MNEALRYLGAKHSDSVTLATVHAMFDWLEENAGTEAAFGRFGCEIFGNTVILGGSYEVISTSLAAHLANCTEAALFAATLGAAVDREMSRLTSKSLYEATVFDACANAFIEAVCDKRCDEFANSLKGDNLHTTPRFSPGYGDLPIDSQRLFFALLRPERRLGITLSNALTLIPVKSVTAFIGISPLPCDVGKAGCEGCSSRETCRYRRS